MGGDPGALLGNRLVQAGGPHPFALVNSHVSLKLGDTVPQYALAPPNMIMVSSAVL
jgi:hypothetical protein